MESPDIDDTADRLRRRLAELERQSSELWVQGMAMGGSAAVHLLQTEIADEMDEIRSTMERLA